MYATALDALVTSQPAARLGGVFGYRMEGDEASLNAELAVIDAAQLGNADWALQLWACDADGCQTMEATASLRPAGEAS